MARFIFTARDQSGNRVNGIEDAESAEDVVSRLQLRGLFATSVKPEPTATLSTRGSARVRAHKFSHTGVNDDDLNIFARQLATVLDSGVPLLKSLNSIAALISSRRFYEAIVRITEDVGGGLSFRDALAKHPKIFSNLWVNLVETGEASGNLPMILDRLAIYLEKRAAFKRKIVSAMVYPIILMVVAFAAITLFVVIVIPKFTEIFTTFEIVLPLPTQILIKISNTLRANILLISIGIGCMIGAFIKYSHTRIGKANIDNLVFKLPVIKNYLVLAETEKFSSTMATLLESGVPILYALEISENSSNNSVVRGIIKKVKDNVREGRPLVVPLEESQFFPPMVTQMIGMGEEIGEVDKMFKKVAIYYSESLEAQVTRFAAMFEPMMIIFMGITIGSMVISMFMPIFKLAQIGSK